jgi:hypothetical protein
MYKFEAEAFGICIVHPRKHHETGVESLERIEIETFHGFRRTVSTYRYERRMPQTTREAQLTEAALCRHAVAQFLQSNGNIHVGREEILNLQLPTFKGKLSPIGEKVSIHTKVLRIGPVDRLGTTSSAGNLEVDPRPVK